MSKCELIENAQNDPNWVQELNAELCMGDCSTCPHNVESEEEKLSKLVDSLVNHFEKKITRRKISSYGF